MRSLQKKRALDFLQNWSQKTIGDIGNALPSLVQKNKHHRDSLNLQQHHLQNLTLALENFQKDKLCLQKKHQNLSRRIQKLKYKLKQSC